MSGIQARSSARSIREAQRRAEMMHLRAEGLTLAQIGERMGVTADAVQGVIDRALRSLVKAPADELRALELARCDELLAEAMEVVRAPMPSVRSGDAVRDPESGAVVIEVVADPAPKLAAINVALRVMERRAKLLGLDMPIKTALTDPSGAAGVGAVTFYMPANGRESVDVIAVQEKRIHENTCTQ